MRTKSNPRLAEIAIRMEIDSRSRTHSHRHLFHSPIKFYRNTSETKKKEKDLKSGNKIGFLHTIKQPSGSNAYFNLLKLRCGYENNRHTSARKHLGLACTQCTCEYVCSCGRKTLIQQKNQGNAMQQLFEKIEHARSTHVRTKKRCNSDFVSVRKKLMTFKTGI